MIDQTMRRAEAETSLQLLLDRYDRRTDTANVAFVVSQPSTGWTWTYGDVNAQYFVASVTKLYTAALVLQTRPPSPSRARRAHRHATSRSTWSAV